MARDSGAAEECAGRSRALSHAARAGFDLEAAGRYAGGAGRQYEGAIESDQGAIDNAKLQLTYTRVTAPIGGLVGLRQVDPGNIVHASDSNGLVVITQMQPITVMFPIPEDNLPQVIKRVKSGAGGRGRRVRPRRKKRSSRRASC